jgi:tetratricopeptide (TPR) repeat protein
MIRALDEPYSVAPMSIDTPTCSDCGSYTRCTGLRAWNQPGLYATAWQCPRCSSGTLVVSPIGPLVPGAGTCPHCGATNDSETCSSCGTDRREVAAWSKATDVATVVDDHYREGLVQRALIVANAALARDPNVYALWSLKCDFLLAIGSAELAEEMVDRALKLPLDDATRAGLLCDRSYLHAEQLCDAPALQAAERALALHANARAVYLKGRALALMGRLVEAADCMRDVLTIQPEHADAQRALAMIEDALVR